MGHDPPGARRYVGAPRYLPRRGDFPRVRTDELSDHCGSTPLMRLSTVHLKDYKSYRGSVTVGPFSSSLTTIVGPNGAGKSTVIDGILFALGASATEGSSVAINHACDSDECSVAVVLVGDGATPARLTIQRRSVHPSAPEPPEPHTSRPSSHARQCESVAPPRPH